MGDIIQEKEYIYEDELPRDITDGEYSEWYEKSLISDGVRVGPKIKRVSHKLNKKTA